MPPKSSIFSARAINQISEHSNVSPSEDFFAAFGNDGVGTIGMPTTINSGDMAGILMIVVQALEKQNKEIRAENADLKARVERLERMIGAYAPAVKAE